MAEVIDILDRMPSVVIVDCPLCGAECRANLAAETPVLFCECDPWDAGE